MFFGENGCAGKAVIYSVDSDIMVLAVHHFQYFSNVDQMWFETGRQDLVKPTSTYRFVPIHDICSSLDPALPEVLPAVHALTGCDSTSAMHYKGKNL